MPVFIVTLTTVEEVRVERDSLDDAYAAAEGGMRRARNERHQHGEQTIATVRSQQKISWGQ